MQLREWEMPRTCVLGHSQPSLRDLSSLSRYPGLTSWATFSRPYGTELVNEVLTQPLEALHGEEQGVEKNREIEEDAAVLDIVQVVLYRLVDGELAVAA
jgi:hypothetical protein